MANANTAYRDSKPSRGIHVRMDAELLDWLDEQAAKRRMSRAALIEAAISSMRRSLEEMDKKIEQEEAQMREGWGDGGQGNG